MLPLPPLAAVHEPLALRGTVKNHCARRKCELIYFGTYWQGHDTSKDYVYHQFDKSVLGH